MRMNAAPINSSHRAQTLKVVAPQLKPNHLPFRSSTTTRSALTPAVKPYPRPSPPASQPASQPDPSPTHPSRPPTARPLGQRRLRMVHVQRKSRRRWSRTQADRWPRHQGTPRTRLRYEDGTVRATPPTLKGRNPRWGRNQRWARNPSSLKDGTMHKRSVNAKGIRRERIANKSSHSSAVEETLVNQDSPIDSHLRYQPILCHLARSSRRAIYRR